MSIQTAAAKTPYRPEKQNGHAGSRFLWIVLLILTGLVFLFSNTITGKISFFFVLFLPFLSLLFVRSAGKHLAASLTLPLSVSKNAPANGTLILQNNSRFSCQNVSVTFTIQNALTGEISKHAVVMQAPAHGSASAAFTIFSEHCGMHKCMTVEAVLCDWFGLFRIRRYLSAEAKVLILPETFPAQITADLPYSEAGDEENRDPLRGTEDPSEIYSLRDYQAGDPVRRIHWKLTAKRDQPVFKEISRPVSRTLLLFWDKATGTQPDSTDALAEAFTSTALSLCEQRIPFVMGWHDRSGTHFETASDEPSLFNALSLALQYGPPDADNSGSAANGSLSGFSKTLWFSGIYPFEAELYLSPESIVFLCNREMSSSGERYTVSFTPEETAHVFRAIRI